MKITYIKQSVFVIELESKILYFDCIQATIPIKHEGKKIYVFITHSHSDHFDPNLFTHLKSATFILAEQIKLEIFPRTTHFMKANEILELDELKVETIGSTDEGVAYIVTMNKKTIFHSGDLNWWHWESENKEDELDNQNMEKQFKFEINKLVGKRIDLAFFPVDPRLKEAAFWGIDYFMNHTDTKKVFPMHFWQDYTIIDKLLAISCSSTYRNKIEVIQKENQVFYLA